VSSCWHSAGLNSLSANDNSFAKKRTKADRLQRQTEQPEKRVDRRPDQIEKKKTAREDVNQAAAQTVREVTEAR
jgi:hypothetical protein